ncbi:MAG: transcriptional repressor [Candidatus Obscuribacter sp.]|nr:transcriptional repressor [Candidatus Obscuribacter sp.]
MITSRLTGTRKTLPKGAKMVLQELSEAREIVSAKELAFRMKLKSPVAAPGLTTVYRSLELLTRLGLVQELVRNEEKQYEMVRPGENSIIWSVNLAINTPE